MRIAVIGTGYVGLVTGTCFAETGNDVTCVDVDAAKIERLRQGQIPIYGPGLTELVESNAPDGRLHFTTDPAAAVEPGGLIFLAVGARLATSRAARVALLALRFRCRPYCSGAVHVFSQKRRSFEPHEEA